MREIGNAMVLKGGGIRGRMLGEASVIYWLDASSTDCKDAS